MLSSLKTDYAIYILRKWLPIVWLFALFQAKLPADVVNIQCGKQVEAAFTGSFQVHAYRISAQAGQVLDLQVVPVGDYLQVLLTVEAAGIPISKSNYDKRLQLQTGKLPADGIYTVKIYNAKRGPDFEGAPIRDIYYDQSMYGPPGLVGKYVFSATCVNGDGTWVAQSGDEHPKETADRSVSGAEDDAGPEEGTQPQGKYAQKAQEVQETIAGVVDTVQAFRDLLGAFRPKKKETAGGGPTSAGAAQPQAYQKPEDVVPKGSQPVYAQPLEAPAAQPQEIEKMNGGGPSSSRPCQDNFTESGEWSYGKTFKSHLVITGTTLEKTFLAMAHGIAGEGFLGVSGNKEMGIVSAYQEDNGKKSTINAVVAETVPGTVRVEVVFHLARELRAPSAAMRDSLCKLLEAAAPTEQQTMRDQVGSSILLRTSAGELPIQTTVGALRKAGAGPVLLFYFDFEGAHADIRTNERKPSLLVHSASDPAKSYLLVRCTSDDSGNRRSVKVGSAGELLKMGVTGKGELAPDKDWTFPFLSEKEAEGVWRLTSAAELKPGEYGLWDVEGYGTTFFGVD